MIQTIISDTIREGISAIKGGDGDSRAIGLGLVYGLGAVAHAIYQVGNAIEGPLDQD